MDRNGAITAGRGLTGHLDEAVRQASGGTPVVIQVVIYDLPNRDCAALASNGELQVDQNGLARYKTEYIDPIAAILANSKYRDLRIVAIVEPDSLPNLVTNLGKSKCAEASSSGAYVQGIQYALNKLAAIPNVYNYLDIAHSGWLGWSSNMGPRGAAVRQHREGHYQGRQQRGRVRVQPGQLHADRRGQPVRPDLQRRWPAAAGGALLPVQPAFRRGRLQHGDACPVRLGGLLQ